MTQSLHKVHKEYFFVAIVHSLWSLLLTIFKSFLTGFKLYSWEQLVI